jgi:hypothetical protein
MVAGELQLDICLTVAGKLLESFLHALAAETPEGKTAPQGEAAGAEHSLGRELQ